MIQSKRKGETLVPFEAIHKIPRLVIKADRAVRSYLFRAREINKATYALIQAFETSECFMLCWEGRGSRTMHACT